MRSGFINAAAAVSFKAGWYQSVASLFRAVKVLLIILVWSFFVVFAVSLQNKSSKPFVPTQTAVVCMQLDILCIIYDDLHGRQYFCGDDSRGFAAPLGAFKVVSSPWPSLRLHPPTAIDIWRWQWIENADHICFYMGFCCFLECTVNRRAHSICLGRSREDRGDARNMRL